MSNFDQIQTRLSGARAARVAHCAKTGEPSGWDATRRTPKVPDRVLGAGATSINPGFDLPTPKASAGQGAQLAPVRPKLLSEGGLNRPKIRSNVTYHSFSTPC
jgi:hypothetical protein